MKLLVLALLILYDSMLIFQLEHVKALDTMAPYAWESGDFRAMRLGRDAAGRPFLDYEELAMAMLTENFDLTGKKDSGYGEPGTTGQFPVHLHLGIYIRTEHHDELSVNPYWILRYLEKYRTRASY